LNFYDRIKNVFRCFVNPENYSSNQTYSPFYIDDEDNIWLQSGQRIFLFNQAQKQFTELYKFQVYGNLIIKPYPQKQLQHLSRVFTLQMQIKGI
jgi:hypothetical protein